MASAIKARLSGRSLRQSILQLAIYKAPSKNPSLPQTPSINALREIEELAVKAKIPIRYTTRDELDRLSNGEVHQNVALWVSPLLSQTAFQPEDNQAVNIDVWLPECSDPQVNHSSKPFNGQKMIFPTLELRCDC